MQSTIERTEPLEESPIPAGGKKAESLVIINTGDGKGKSSAAFGVMCRAAGHGQKVCVIQFIKSDKWVVGEEKAAKTLGVTWHKVGDGFTWESENLEHDKELAREGWRLAAEAITSAEYDLVVLDELTYLLNWEWIEPADVIEVITKRPERVNIIITGRDCSTELLELADTATEMTKIKHAYDTGILAKVGIDF